MLDKKPFSYLISFALGALGVFLVVLVVSEIVSVQNKIKEGRYIGLDVTRSFIDVSGEGEVWANPDLAQATLSIVTEDRTVANVQSQNTQKMNKLIEFLKEMGIAEKDLKTTQYNIQPRYEYPERSRVFVGYQVSQSLEVKIRDFDNIGKILSGAASKGVNQVGTLAFTFDDPDSLQKQARKLAIEDAKNKAREIASDLGVTLFRVAGFNEGFALPYEFRAMDQAALEGLPAAEIPKIEPGENVVRSLVTITYEIY